MIKTKREIGEQIEGDKTAKETWKERWREKERQLYCPHVKHSFKLFYSVVSYSKYL